MSTSPSFPVSPPDQRCVWMSAGLLTYQLCDKDFDCSSCPLDQAMRNRYASPGGAMASRALYHVATLPLGRYYTQEHCWISIRSPRTVRVGIEPNLVARCRGMKGITLPPSRRTVPARVPGAWCRFEQGMIPVRLPITVRTTELNTDVVRHPDMVCDDPFEGGWLFEAEIEPDQLDACGLMSAWQAEKVYYADEEAFQIAIRDTAGQMGSPIGETAFDGGAAADGLIQSIGCAQYCFLVSRTYCKVS